MARLTKNSKKSKKSLFLTAVPLAVLIAGCGGGGGDATTDTAPTASAQTVAVTGTVPGTIIQAYCSDGSNPSVSSLQNGTDQHPFTLNVPTGVDCRIAMITNEGTVNQVITNLTFNGNSIINLQQPLDLAHIPLAMSPDAAIDLNNDGFADLDITLSAEGVSFANTLNYAPVNGRLLASQCFQCHGTNGRSVNGWDSILGESYSEILEELAEYPVTHIMGAQAVGYSLSERQALASYLSGMSVGSDVYDDERDDERDDEEYDEDDHDDHDDEHDDEDDHDERDND